MYKTFPSVPTHFLFFFKLIHHQRHKQMSDKCYVNSFAVVLRLMRCIPAFSA